MTEEEIRTEKEKSRAFVETFTMEPTVAGLLSGLSFAVKDLIDVQGFKTGMRKPHMEGHSSDRGGQCGLCGAVALGRCAMLGKDGHR